MPKDQGEACSLLAFRDSSHGWLDHLVVSMFLPCLEATSASPYRLNRLHTLSLESGAALQTLELCKSTGTVLLAAATTQDAGRGSVKPTKWKVVVAAFRRKPVEGGSLLATKHCGISVFFSLFSHVSCLCPAATSLCNSTN